MTQKNNTTNSERECNQHQLLVTYLYGEATGEERQQFEMHRQACASCEQELGAFEGVRHSLQQWRLEDLPNVRVVVEPPRRSALALVKELFMAMPLWTRGFAAAAAALVLFAVLGMEIHIGRDGFQMRAGLFQAGKNSPAGTSSSPGTSSASTISEEQVKQIRADLIKEIEARIDESDRQRDEALKAQLVSFEEQLQVMRSADLLKLAARVQEHNAKLKTIERDIDRREGLGLSDIVFGEAQPAPGTKSGNPNGSE